MLGLIYQVGASLVDLLGVSVPANLAGLLLMLGLLSSGLLRPMHVEELATFLLRHLTF